MIKFEIKGDKIILNNADNVKFNDKVKVFQTITQELDKESAKLVYENMNAQIKQLNDLIKNSETAVEAENVKIELNKKQLKHIKRAKKLLESTAKEAKIDLIEEVVVNESE